VLALRVNGQLICGIDAVRNPEKLSHMEVEVALRG
jgi:hypothetical protein